MVPYFKYLGRVLLAAYDDWPAVIKTWWRRGKFGEECRGFWAGREIGRGCPVFSLKPLSNRFIFSAETWGVTPHTGQVLGSFQDQVARLLKGWLPRCRLDGRWEYTSAKVSREEAEFEQMETYICKSQNMFTQYIATQLIMYLCNVGERKRGAWVGMQWREQAELDLAGARETAAVVAEANKDRMEE